ncbi:Yrb2p NDAI_0A02470 [Naumovozyma dairenensis CBS 421]|uniref:RanBD1 domain-containing protein n=1 Tax=Naumovozyma dairenensis (strain ATCC 10597 / BCRC 20456 / CBS 421 / NBRC 0211 / NRRL Y-12639) TaxID=1071378 RepID=G0W3L7_NAUDC|nr:hypothetical protein NDAI_0A02470 [Naumovozyma dairenensis CBS 421]CCD22405.1 hypothetical protein NDAI_0A02470 [Naumovozyma dairenensis CBS 421]
MSSIDEKTTNENKLNDKNENETLKRSRDDSKADTINNNTKKVKLDQEKKADVSDKEEAQPTEIDEDQSLTKKTDEDSKENNEKQTEKEEDSSIPKEDVKKDQEEKVEEKEKTGSSPKEGETTKPKFVFGSKTLFGSGFGAAKVPHSSESKDQSPKGGNSKPFSFGSGLSFGSGFGVLKKSDETEPTSSKEQSTTADDSKSEAKEKLPKKENTEDEKKKEEEESTVKLHKQDVKSGEESEDCIFQANAKLYQLSDIKSGWKERGLGTIKVNKDNKTGKARIIMRTRTVMKVILNLPLVKGFTIHKGFPGSLQSEKFVRIIAVDDKNLPVQYALKTGKEETTTGLYDAMIDSIPK